MKDLNWWRCRIDRVDRGILAMMAKRMKFAKGIAEVKMLSGKPVLDESREAEVIMERQALARELGLNPGFARHLMIIVMNESKRNQKNLLKRRKKFVI